MTLVPLQLTKPYSKFLLWTKIGLVKATFEWLISTFFCFYLTTWKIDRAGKGILEYETGLYYFITIEMFCNVLARVEAHGKYSLL